MSYPAPPDLQRHRHQTVARSFYRQLRTEGFSPQEIIELSTNLLDLVTQDLRSTDGAHPISS